MNSDQARQLWDAIAELRDELHTIADELGDLSRRVDHVHREALRSLTHTLKGRTDADTRHGS